MNEARIPMHFGFGSQERYWTDPPGGDRPGWYAGWEARWYIYDIEERDDGFWLSKRQEKHLMEGAPRYGGIYDERRVPQVKPLQEVGKKKIVSNLEKRLKELSI